MKIIVCVKQVPDSEAAITLQGGSLDSNNAPMVLNPFDEYAVEGALQLKDNLGAEVIALTVGSEKEVDALRRTLAMGADSAVLVKTDEAGQLDNLTIAKLIASTIRKIGDVDLLLFGRQTIDNGSGILQAQVARLLRWPLLGYSGRIELANPGINADRILEDSKVTIESTLPAVASIVQSIGEPRYPSFIGIKRAQKAEIGIIEVAELGVEATKVGHQAYAMPTPKAATCEMISGADAQEIAKKAVAKIMEAKVL